MNTLHILFFGTSLALIAGFVAYFRNVTQTARAPRSFDRFFRTSGPGSKETITASQIDKQFQEFSDKHGKATRDKSGIAVMVKLNNNNVTSPMLWLQGKCNELAKQKMVFDLVYDLNRFDPLTLSSDDRLRPVTFDRSHFDQDPELRELCHIGALNITNSNSWISLNGLQINSIYVHEKYNGFLYISNCWIKKLTLGNNETDMKPRVHIHNSWIGSLHLEEKCCYELTVSGGGLNILATPPPFQNNPFCGPVNFVKHPSLRWEQLSSYDHSQTYRSLSSHLSKLGNISASKYVEGFAKRIERKNETILIRYISLFYDFFSFYGNSPERAITILFALTLYSVFLFYCLDGSVITKSCFELVGWQKEICGENMRARLIRSLYISFTTIANPLSIIFRENIVIAKTIGFNIFLIFQGILSILLLAIFVIGVRRRFVSQ